MSRSRACAVQCAIAGLLSLAFNSATGAQSFNGLTVAPTYEVSGNRAEVFADFNGDGKMDLAVVGPGEAMLSILLGNGDGTFQPAMTTTLSYAKPVALVAGHFKSSTIVDLAVAYSSNNNVTVLTGNGDGTFNLPNCTSTPQLCPSVGINPASLAALTLVKGSAYQDLAVVNAGSSSVTLLQNRRNGTGDMSAITCSSTTGSTCTVGSNPVSIVADDINGDGIVDLAVANAGSSNISVLLGTGKTTGGAFQAALTYGLGTGTTPLFIAAGDLDGDTETDLVVANARGGASGIGNLTVLLNTGNNTSGQPVFTTTNVNAGPNPQAVAVATLKSGAPDLAVADGAGNQALVLLNNGSGSFSVSGAYTVGGLPVWIAAADLTGDGSCDLAVVNANDADVSILINNGNGVFSAAATYQAGTTPVSIVSQNFDGSGNLSLAVVNEASNNVSVSLGNGLGQFKAPVNFAVGTGVGSQSPVSVATADLNGDGKPDLAVANQATNVVSVLLNNSTAKGVLSFQAAVNYATGTGPSSVAIGDFRGNGEMDLVVANRGSNNVSVLLGNGNGTFQNAVNYSVGSSPCFVLIADFNGDGKPDLAVANAGSNTIGILLGNGNGTFQPMIGTTVGETPMALASGVFKSGDIADLVVANYNDNDVWLLLGNGNGTFQKPATYLFPTDLNPTSVTAIDVNGDGNLDAVVANAGGNDISVLLGTGTGGFSSPINCPAGGGPFAVTAGRFQGTSNPVDVAVTDEADNSMTVLIQPSVLPAQPTCNEATQTKVARRMR